MGKRKVTSYSLEFKQSSGKLARESDHPISTTAGELGVHEATLHGWVRRLPSGEERRQTWCNDCRRTGRIKTFKKRIGPSKTGA